MDNRTIRLAVMRRCPEVYWISEPRRGLDEKQKIHKIYWLMYAKIAGQKRPTRLQCDMLDTAIISHNALLSTMVNEIYDEIKDIRTGRKTPPDDPWDEGRQELSAEGQKVFDSPEIQYMSVGAPNVNPNAPKKSSIIMP